MTEDTKKCSKCGEEKPLEAFYTQPNGPIGRMSQCKVCCLARQREARATRRPLLEYAADQRILERFLAFVDVRGPDECWPWTGGTRAGGYGWFSLGVGVQVRASRFALAAAGIDPGELDALHSCHNPPCCNPAHLRPGTHQDNMLDMALAERARHKITHAQADEIRELLAAGVTQREAGGRYGIGQSAVKDIHLRRTHNTGEAS